MDVRVFSIQPKSGGHLTGPLSYSMEGYNRSQQDYIYNVKLTQNPIFLILLAQKTTLFKRNILTYCFYYIKLINLLESSFPSASDTLADLN